MKSFGGEGLPVRVTHAGRASAAYALAGLVALFAILPACKLDPDYSRPDTPLPAKWEAALNEPVLGGRADVKAWWKVESSSC